MITADDAEEYTQALGQVMAGGWRQRLLAWRLGVPQALGMSLEEWTEDRLGGYVRQSIPERREAVAELANEGLSTREIEEVLGVGKSTIARDLSVPNGTDDAMVEAEDEPSTVPNGTADEPSEMDEPEPEPDLEPEPNEPPKPHVSNNSGNVEWFTPRSYIEAARSTLGGIDLDPASSEAANEVVRAATFYDQTTDGLSQPWHGRLWMNPPYAAGLVDKFCDRMATNFNTGRVTSACVLVNNATETNWFQTVAAVASAICFVRGRVRFWHPDRPSITPLQGQAVLYLGDDYDRFAVEFKAFGLVVNCQ